MSATIIPLPHRRTGAASGVVGAACTGSLNGEPIGASMEARIRVMQADLEAHRERLLTVLENQRGQDLRDDPHLRRITTEIEAVAARTLTEIALFTRRTESLLEGGRLDPAAALC